MHRDFYEKLGEIASKKRGSETMELFEKLCEILDTNRTAMGQVTDCGQNLKRLFSAPSRRTHPISGSQGWWFGEHPEAASLA